MLRRLSIPPFLPLVLKFLGPLEHCLVVSYLRHHVLRLLPGVDELVDLAVESQQVQLHVLLLTLVVLWLLVTEELVVDLRRFFAVGILLIPVLRVGVSLHHEALPTLFGASLQILSRLREDVAEV